MAEGRKSVLVSRLVRFRARYLRVFEVVVRAYPLAGVTGQTLRSADTLRFGLCVCVGVGVWVDEVKGTHERQELRGT